MYVIVLRVGRHGDEMHLFTRVLMNGRVMRVFVAVFMFMRMAVFVGMRVRQITVPVRVVMGMRMAVLMSMAVQVRVTAVMVVVVAHGRFLRLACSYQQIAPYRTRTSRWRRHAPSAVRPGGSDSRRRALIRCAAATRSSR